MTVLMPYQNCLFLISKCKDKTCKWLNLRVDNNNSELNYRGLLIFKPSNSNNKNGLM